MKREDAVEILRQLAGSVCGLSFSDKRAIATAIDALSAPDGGALRRAVEEAGKRVIQEYRDKETFIGGPITKAAASIVEAAGLGVIKGHYLVWHRPPKPPTLLEAAKAVQDKTIAPEHKDLEGRNYRLVPVATFDALVAAVERAEKGEGA